MYQTSRVKTNSVVLVLLCCSFLFLTLCGKPDGPSSPASDIVSVTSSQSPLTDNKPHLLNELFAAVTNPVTSILEIDADNDGLKDILLTTAENEVYTLVNKNNGTYIAASLLPSQTPESMDATGKQNPYADGKLNKDDMDSPPAHEPVLVSTETADINKDGYDDIILAYAGTENSPVKILCGNSIGAYDDLSTVLLPNLDIPAPAMVKAADVNSDGFKDIIVTSFGKTKIDPYGVKTVDTRNNYILINSGAFTDETMNLFGEDFAYTPAIDVQVNDVSSDGRNELVLIKPDGNLLYENVDGKFLPSSFNETITPQPAQNRMITVDVDNNGNQDTIAISNGTPIIIYDTPNSLQKPIGLPTQDSGLQTSYVSPFQYKITGPGGKDTAGIKQTGDVIYLEFDSAVAAYVWGNIVLSFDPARLRCVSIEENPNNWHGFWVWWTPATSMPEYGGGGTPYFYDSNGKGSGWARTWASWYGPGVAGPVGSYNNTLGKIWLYTSTLAGYSYTSPLRIGFEVLQRGTASFTAQSNNFTAYDFHTVDSGTVSTVNIVQHNNCETNEDPLNNARVSICGPDQVETGQPFVINVVGQTINPIYSFGNNVYSWELYENDVLLYRKGFNWGEEHISAYDFTKTIPGSYTYKYRYRDGSKVHAGYGWVQAEITVIVKPPVHIDSVYPDIGCTGNTEQVVINGNGFTQEMAVSFGEEIAVNVTDVQPDKITADITPAFSTALGLRPVSVGAATKENAFTVIDIQISGDEYVPVGTGATADLQAQIIPADALSGREISYSWQVNSGAGTLTQTNSLNTSFMPSVVETAIVDFTVYISGAVCVRSAYIKTWDFDFIIRPIQAPAAKTVYKPDQIQQQQQGDIYKDTEIAIALGQSVEAVIVFNGITEEDTISSVTSQKPEIVGVSENKPWILTGLKGGDSSVVTAGVTDANNKSKTRQKTIYVIGTITDSSNQSQSSSVILPKKLYIYNQKSQAYTLWAIENGVAVPVPAKWTLPEQHPVDKQPQTKVAGFTGANDGVNSVTVNGLNPGKFTLHAIPGKAAIPEDLLINVVKVELKDNDGKPSVSAKKDGTDGGVNHFSAILKGFPAGLNVTLKLAKTKGNAGSAIFEGGTDTMTIAGNTNTIKVRGGNQSDIARNMELQAFLPDNEMPYETVPFTVFWLEPDVLTNGPVPDDAISSKIVTKLPTDILLKNNVIAIRKDGLNQLGFCNNTITSSADTGVSSRGFALLRFKVVPNGVLEADLKANGPTDGFEIIRNVTSRIYVYDKARNLYRLRFPLPIGLSDKLSDISSLENKDLIANFNQTDLYIYDLDGPSLPQALFPSNADYEYLRTRNNFEQWATYTDDEKTNARCSILFNWYFRASWHRKTDGTIVDEGVALDNEVKTGITPLTYDLLPSTVSNFNVTNFTPINVPVNTNNDFRLQINGKFPRDLPESQYRWEVQLVSSPMDKISNLSGTEDDFILADQVERDPTGNILLVKFNLAQGSRNSLGYPAPAKKYNVRVMNLDIVKEVPDALLSITENKPDHWVVGDFGTSPPDATGKKYFILEVLLNDSQGNIVTLPGQKPTVKQSAGNAIFNPETLFFKGRYGDFWMEAEIIADGSCAFEVSGCDIGSFKTEIKNTKK